MKEIGLRRSFEKVVSLLKGGGFFVLEPQGWDSYGHAVKKHPGLKAKKEALKIMPEAFPVILQELGMEVVKKIEGRKREIWVFMKRYSGDVLGHDHDIELEC